jgi:hypothetical protein
MALFKVETIYMKAITMFVVTAMLMASVMGEDELDDVSGGVYDSGSAVFSGGKGLAITQHGLLVEDGILTLTTKGTIARCGDIYYGNGQIMTKSNFLFYGSQGVKVQDGNYYSGKSGSTYIFSNNDEE